MAPLVTTAFLTAAVVSEKLDTSDADSSLRQEEAMAILQVEPATHNGVISSNIVSSNDQITGDGNGVINTNVPEITLDPENVDPISFDTFDLRNGGTATFGSDFSGGDFVILVNDPSQVIDESPLYNFPVQSQDEEGTTLTVELDQDAVNALLQTVRPKIHIIYNKNAEGQITGTTEFVVPTVTPNLNGYNFDTQNYDGVTFQPFWDSGQQLKDSQFIPMSAVPTVVLSPAIAEELSGEITDEIANKYGTALPNSDIYTTQFVRSENTFPEADGPE